jgi:tetratricopeptide (TPR) repeat protein
MAPPPGARGAGGKFPRHGSEDAADAAALPSSPGVCRAPDAEDPGPPRAPSGPGPRIWGASLEAELRNLGDGRPAAAAKFEPQLLEELAALRSTLGVEHPDTLSSVSDLGQLLQARGKLDAAEPLVREALAGRRRLLGDTHPCTLASMSQLGRLLRARGDLGAAEALLREALSAQRRALGDEHPDTLSSVSKLGQLLQSRGDLDGAAPLLREALAGRRRVLGDVHPKTLASVSKLGLLLMALGSFADAEPLLREALARQRRLLGDAHRSTLASAKHLGLLLQVRGGDIRDADPLFREGQIAKPPLVDLGGTLRARGNSAATSMPSPAPAEAPAPVPASAAPVLALLPDLDPVAAARGQRAPHEASFMAHATAAGGGEAVAIAKALRAWAPSARVRHDLDKKPPAACTHAGVAAAGAASTASPAFRGPAADSRLGELLIDAVPLACAHGFALDLHHVRYVCGATFREGARRADGSLDSAGFLGGTADMIKNATRLQVSWLAAARAKEREIAGEERCSTQLFRASAAGDEQRVRELVAAGAPLRGAPCEGGWSTLHRAAFSGHAGVIAALVDGRGAGLGAEVDRREANHMRRTALIIACEQAHEGAVRALLARGADVGAQDSTGFCALHTAVLRGEHSVLALLCAAPGAAAAMALRARRSNGIAPGGADDVVLTPLGFALHWGGAAREACAAVLRAAGAV